MQSITVVDTSVPMYNYLIDYLLVTERKSTYRSNMNVRIKQVRVKMLSFFIFILLAFMFYEIRDSRHVPTGYYYYFFFLQEGN